MKLKVTRPVWQCTECTYKYEVAPKKCVNCDNDKFVNKEVYCFDAILSYNAFINAIVGGRRGGKTYCAAEYCVQQWEEKGKKFVWLRRFKTENAQALKTFQKFGYEIDSRGVFYSSSKTILKLIRGKETEVEVKEKIYIGNVINVSTASRIRGGEFPNHTTIVWDEYGDEYGTSLRNEWILLNSLIVSIFDEKSGCKVFILSNNINRFLPLFLHLEVRWDQEWTYNWQKDAVIHVWNRDGFKLEGSAAKYLESTSYYNYAFKNIALDQDRWLFEKYKLEFSTPHFCFRLGMVKETLRLIYYEDLYVIDTCEKCHHDYFVIDELNAIYQIKAINLAKQNELIDYYFSRNLRFTNPNIKRAFFDWLQRKSYL